MSQPNGQNSDIDYIHPSHPTAWTIQPANSGGVLVRSNYPPHKRILCRVADGKVYLFDNSLREEVSIHIADLVRLSTMG